MTSSDVESTNLHLLMAIRLGIEADCVGASSRFALSAALVAHLRGLGHPQLCAFVAHVGQSTLFPPRRDLLDLMTSPLPLAGALAAVRMPWPAVVPPAPFQVRHTER